MLIKIFENIASLLGMILQTLLRIGITRGERDKMTDAMRTLEHNIDDKEQDIKEERK